MYRLSDNHEPRLNYCLYMNGYIYKITNKINNKIYIGMSSNVDNRWKYGHVLTAKKLIDNIDIGYKSLLYDAMKKYGIENFNIEIIEECPIEKMGEREEYWINKLNSRDRNIGYNICRGGCRGPGGPMFAGHHHSEETKAKMSADRTGSKNSNYGNHWTQSDELKELHRQLSSGKNNPMYGKKHTEASKEKSRLSHLGKKRMSNLEMYPKYKMIDEKDVKIYQNLGWFLLSEKPDNN